ncbi:MAG: MaoC/PaaZ C-terminal domain-containing protein [Thermoleophilaceae bacterium]
MPALAEVAPTTPTAPVPLREGDALPTIETEPITRTQLVRYAGASGDFNPMHHDEEFATRAGMPSVFAHGLLQSGTLASVLARWVGLANLRSYSTRFVGEVWPGDVLELNGRVDAVREAGRERIAECSFSVAGPRGEVLRGKAAARVV